MTNEELVIRIKSGINPAEHMKQLWEQNRGMIGKIAMKYQGYGEIEDLKQQGFIGLCNAVEGYEPDQGIPFGNYAWYWIRHSMGRYLEECGSIIRIPSHARGQIKEYRRMEASFERTYGRKATEKEMSLLLQNLTRSRKMPVWGK